MKAFDESVADAAGAGFIGGGDSAVCAMAALHRIAVRNAVFRLKPIRDINGCLPDGVVRRCAMGIKGDGSGVELVLVRMSIDNRAP